VKIPSPRQVKRYRPESQTAEQPGQEHHHAGGEKRTHVVAEHFFDILQGLGVPDHVQHIPLAQPDVGSGRAVESIARDARDLHSEDMAEVQCAQGLSGHVRAGEQDFFFHEHGIEGQISLHHRSDDHLGLMQRFRCPHHPYRILHVQDRFRHCQFRAFCSHAQYAGDGHLGHTLGKDLGQRSGAEIGVGDPEVRELHLRMQAAQFLLQFFFFLPDACAQQTWQELDHQHHADHAERVGHAVCRRGGALMGQFHGHGQARRGGQSPGEESGGDLLGKSEPGLAAKGGKQPHEYHGQGSEAQRHSSAFHGMQKTRPGLLAHGIDEQDQSKALHHSRQTQTRESGQKSGEDDARGAQGKGKDFDFAEQVSGQNDGKQQKYGIMEEFHARGSLSLFNQLMPEALRFPASIAREKCGECGPLTSLAGDLDSTFFLSAQ
jgi:hypothetical protein